MSRRRFVRNSALSCLNLGLSPMLNFGRVRIFASEKIEISTRAADLVLGTTVIDMLGLLTLDWAKLFRWHRGTSALGDHDFRQLELSGINVFHPAVDTGLNSPDGAALKWLEGWNLLLGSHVCKLERIETASDLLRVPSSGKIGVIVGFQNSVHFKSPDDVATYFALGQRVSQLTYNERNRLGSGCYERWDRGLTAFGGEIVSAMNGVGMAVDVSHCGERTSLDAIAAGRQPTLITHGNCRALNRTHPRCKSDAVIRKMAASGGVMGITMVKSFVGDNPTVETLLDHFTHVAKLTGVEHVGIGSDADIQAVDPKSGRPLSFYAIAGLDPRARVFQIADGLLRRGFGTRDVALILGGNFQRVLNEIWPAVPRTDGSPREWKRDPFCPAPNPGMPDSVTTTGR